MMVSSSGFREQFDVAVTFDRRRITSCNCTCSSAAYWCSHVVAVCLHRIHMVRNLDNPNFFSYPFLSPSLSRKFIANNTNTND